VFGCRVDCLVVILSRVIFQIIKIFLFQLSNFPFQTVKVFLFKLSKFSFSKLSNFPFQTVKIFLFKLSKFSFSKLSNFPFQTVKIFLFQTVKFSFSKLSKFSFSKLSKFSFHKQHRQNDKCKKSHPKLECPKIRPNSPPSTTNSPLNNFPFSFHSKKKENWEKAATTMEGGFSVFLNIKKKCSILKKGRILIRPF
jgi:hypothetical protein